MEQEQWKPIQEFSGEYEVSNLGRVRSMKRYGGQVGRIMPQTRQPSGRGGKLTYFAVMLWMNNKAYCRKVHRLVAEAFIPNPDNLPTVNHKDENKQNNRADNLEWMSVSANNHHGTRGQRAGMANARKRKAVVQLDIDGREVNRFVSLNEASRATGISLGAIGKCVKGEHQSAGGYRWRYAQ